jgi:transcriptional regulator with PAS, ATPase and Fis domain
MSPAMQAKLLRVLQYKEFTPLGAKETRRTNARIIAATNEDLAAKVADGAFREDLFYRLQVVNIHLPPLRERMDDLPALVRTLLARINEDLRSGVSRISLDVMDCLGRYHWPGNVRELENLLMKAVALCPGNALTPDLLPAELCGGRLRQGAPAQPASPGLGSLEEMEKEHVARVLRATGWHRGQACDILGVSRPRLRRMIRQYGFEPPSGLEAGEDDAEEDGKD